MQKEEGVVTRVEAETAWVKTERSGACESCASKGFCSTLGGGKITEVAALNKAGAHEGDRVVITCESASVFKVSFLVYLFPIICMVIGAVVGNQTAPRFNLDPSAFSAILGFACLFVSFLLVHIIGKKLSAEDQYKPKVTRIL